VLSGVALATGGAGVCAVDEAHHVACWYGGAHAEPVGGALIFLTLRTAEGGVLAGLDAGGGHFCGIAADDTTALEGTLYCWGDNGHGQLGDGTTTSHTIPTAVAGGLHAKGLALGAEHTCARTTSDTVYCWGRGDQGQLGNGATLDRPTPTPVAGDLQLGFVAAGRAHTCAITPAIPFFNPLPVEYCWGADDHRALGGETPGMRTVPTPIAAPTVVYSLTAGGDHTCGLGIKQEVVLCWGEGGAGQLGHGAAADSPTPVAVNGIGELIGLAAGVSFTCDIDIELEHDGAFCWGSNAVGQFGNGTTSAGPNPSATPAASGLRLWRIDAAPAGREMVCGVDRYTGRVLCWGELPDGTIHATPFPIPR
jgi:hypothetical protein